MNQSQENISITVYAFIHHGDRLLLTRDREGKPGWKLPGGHREVGETIQQALEREIEEEVGIKLQPEKIFLIKDFFRTEPSTYNIRIFIKGISKTSAVIINKDELIDAQWFSIIEAKEIPEGDFYEDHREIIKSYLTANIED